VEAEVVLHRRTAARVHGRGDDGGGVAHGAHGGGAGARHASQRVALPPLNLHGVQPLQDGKSDFAATDLNSKATWFGIQ
jgi:hypothetical protein